MDRAAGTDLVQAFGTRRFGTENREGVIDLKGEKIRS
jgi:hypothetical protein